MFLAFSSVNAETYPICVGDPAESEQAAAARAFKKYVEEKTNGHIRLNLYYASQLADESEAYRNVQKGALPFAVGGVVNLVPFDKRLGILTLPYLFNNLEEAIKGTGGEAAKILENYARQSGFRILCWTCTDFRYISNSRRPIRNLADMRGLKFRVPQSPVMIASYKAFGASPAPIAWAETFTALQQGVVDGQCYGYIGFASMKFIDARQKYLTEVHYTYQIQPLLMSERFYQSLSPEKQALFVAAGKYARKEALAYLQTAGPKAKGELLAAGLHVSQLEDEEEWRKIAFQQVWPQMAPEMGGAEAINRYLEAMGKKPWMPGQNR